MKKLRTHDRHFSTRLPYANKKIREIYYSTVNSTYNTTEDMMKKLQSLRGKTKLHFFKNLSNY